MMRSKLISFKVVFEISGNKAMPANHFYYTAFFVIYLAVITSLIGFCVDIEGYNLRIIKVLTGI